MFVNLGLKHHSSGRSAWLEPPFRSLTLAARSGRLSLSGFGSGFKQKAAESQRS